MDYSEKLIDEGLTPFCFLIDVEVNDLQQKENEYLVQIAGIWSYDTFL